ncbi:MAG: ABC transporter substrate-binding protein [Elusimicrobia bacterium]|nr:ABC transporter substrate-binding protein [Elusimicrobiota bacterium]
MHIKKFLTSAMILSLILLIHGCGKKDNQLVFMVGGATNEIDYWEELVKKFKIEYPDIEITLLRQPTDTEQRRQGLVIPLKSGQKNPDVFLMDVVWVKQFAASGWLEPLDDFMNKEKFDKSLYFQRILKSVDVYNNSIIALPVYVDGGLLYYRSDLLKKYGFSTPPETWHELVKYSSKVQSGERKQNKNFWGFVWQGAQYEGLVCNLLEYIGSNNGDITEDDKFKINTKKNTEAIRFMSDLINKYKISPPNTYTEMKEEEVRTFFQSGNALFERNWPYAYKLHQSGDSPVKNKFKITKLPYFKNGRSASTIGGWHIGVSKFSDTKEASWKFVRFITSFEVQKGMAMDLGWNPGRMDVYDSKDVMSQLPHLKVLKAVLENAVARPGYPYYTQISESVQKYVNMVLAGKIQPSKAVEKIQEESGKIIKNYEE